ncbi:MAG: glyoxalase [Ilumatobacteraceae bacterium]|nr:glyoxalase [Ilumatobacteraceae bacterium]
MSRNDRRRAHQAPPHGQLGYLQLPAVDIARSLTFYEAVFGWSGELEHGSFEAPGLIGQWVTDRAPSGDSGAVLWLCADDLYNTLREVVANGGVVHDRPRMDQRARWLVEIDDPAGNRIGIFVPARTARPQTLLTVRDVEASSRWYQYVIGLQSDHGGPDYERLLADGELALQLHHNEVEHDHGQIADPSVGLGNGVLVWFGDVSDFDGAVERASELGAPIVNAVMRNPPEGAGNGPGHRELWIKDPDGYTVVIASPDGEAWEV